MLLLLLLLLVVRGWYCWQWWWCLWLVDHIFYNNGSARPANVGSNINVDDGACACDIGCMVLTRTNLSCLLECIVGSLWQRNSCLSAALRQVYLRGRPQGGRAVDSLWILQHCRKCVFWIFGVPIVWMIRDKRLIVQKCIFLGWSGFVILILMIVLFDSAWKELSKGC